MLDRVPTMVLPNGAIRYGVYNADGTLNRYEYIKPEDAPTQAGTPINRASLLKDTTAALYGLPASAVPDDVFQKIKADINGINLLYEKIRNITASSATGTLSVSLSDVDWNVWRETRLICDLKLSTRAWIYPRINSLSAGNYNFSILQPGGPPITMSTATSMVDANFVVEAVDGGSQLDISIQKQVFNGSTYFCWTFNKLVASGGVKSGVGFYNANTTDLSNLNLVSSNAAYTVSLSKASLWGVRK